MKDQIVLSAQDLTRVWNLALMMAANDEASEGDLAVVFPQALETYLGFRQHLSEGGLQIDDGDRTWTSELTDDGSLVLTAPQKSAVAAAMRAPAATKGGAAPKGPAGRGGKKQV